MIEELINEMTEDCNICYEGYIYNPKDTTDNSDEPEKCPSCDGKGKAISYEGEKLRHLILKGELL